MPSDPKLTDNTPDSSSPSSNASAQFATALELPIVFVGAVLLGGFLGFYLDRWLHTKPWLMFVFGALGFFGGIREIIRRTSGNPRK
jgi:F0F1-type ATP synthase assembly protein I